MKLPRLAALVTVAALATVASASGAGAESGWQYVYGDPGPTNYSKYQAVKIDPEGGAFLVGFFSGSFEGYSSTDSYTVFIQHRNASGAVDWTKALNNTGTVLPKEPLLVLNASNVALIRTCTDASCQLTTYDRSGTQLGTAVQSEADVDLVASGFGFIRLTLPTCDAELEGLANDLSSTWTHTVAAPCLAPAVWPQPQPSTARLAGDGTGGAWVAFSIAPPLPTLYHSLAFVRIDGAGNEVTTIKHYGRSLGKPNLKSPFVIVNRDFMWVWTYDYLEPNPYGSLNAQITAFRTDNGAVIGNIRCTSRLDLLCHNDRRMHPRTHSVFGAAGRRYVELETADYICAVPCLKIIDLTGNPAVSPTLVRQLTLASNPLVVDPLGANWAFDADEFGNVLIAGSTADGIVFLSGVSASTQAEPVGVVDFALGSTRAFVAQNPGGRVPLKLTPFVPLEIQVTGRDGVPATGVSAVSLNVTVTSPGDGGYVTVYPCGGLPDASNLNYVAGQTVPNAVIAPVSATGTICFYSYATTHLIADVNGYFPAGSGFIPSPPVRVFDTRPGAADGLRVVPKAKVGGAVELRVKLTDLPGYVPSSGVGAVSLNVTVNQPDGNGYVTVYPCGGLPDASNLNYVAGQTVPNAVIAPVSASGEVCFFSYAKTHLIVDVNGYFPTSSGFVASSPVRVFDTRPGAADGLRVVPKARVGGAVELRVKLTDLPGYVPASGVGAVSLNVTVNQPVADGFVTVYPCGGLPNASNLNYVAGQTVPNAVISPVSASGEVCFYSYSDAHLIADVNGYFPTGGGFVALTPYRRFDTR